MHLPPTAASKHHNSTASDEGKACSHLAQGRLTSVVESDPAHLRWSLGIGPTTFEVLQSKRCSRASPLRATGSLQGLTQGHGIAYDTTWARRRDAPPPTKRLHIPP